MEINKFSAKLNKIDGNVYVIEEEAVLSNGVYEAELAHDNVNEATISVYTGPKLTGKKIENFVLSIPNLEPWKRLIRIYADEDIVYISYETEGDTVEAEDINKVQEAVRATQEALNEENFRAELAEQQIRDDLQNEISRAKNEEKAIKSELQIEKNRASDAEQALSDSLSQESARASAAEQTLAKNLSSEINRAIGEESAIKKEIVSGRPIWEDKYTRNETDNKFSALETAIDWKESVDTYDDILTAYPAPEDGWTVNVKDTDYTYRWNGNEWVAISANTIPKATQLVDGLLSKEDKLLYDDANNKKHSHSNKSVLDKITQALTDAWNLAYEKLHEHKNKSLLDGITQENVDVWNTVNNKVDHTDLQYRGLTSYSFTEDGFMASEDNMPRTLEAHFDTIYGNFDEFASGIDKKLSSNTTYSLTKSGNTIKLTGSDGSETSVADSNTTYGVASSASNGLMSASDKVKLDGIAANANAYTLPTATRTVLGGVKTTSTVTSSSGYTACPIISGVPYYKDTNTTYGVVSTSANGLCPARPGGTTKFLRADGTWAVPSSGTADTDIEAAGSGVAAYANALAYVNSSDSSNTPVIFFKSANTNGFSGIYDVFEFNGSDCIALGMNSGCIGHFTLFAPAMASLILEQNGDKIVLRDNEFYPGAAQTIDLGTSSYQWKNIYASNGTIQTSDRTKKKDIFDLDAAAMTEFIMGLRPSSYKMTDGTSDRTHYGMIAQDVEELLARLGMDTKDFAGFVKSPKIEITEDERGRRIKNVVEGEYDYSLRYDEFIAPLIKMCQYLYHEVSCLKEEVRELSEKVS